MRLAGILAVGLALYLACPAGARTLKPGSVRARWPIKTSVAPDARLGHPRVVALEKLLGLADVPGVSAQDSRFSSDRIPTAVDGLHEGDIVRTTGWVHVVALEDDGDYHIQVTGSKTSGDHCLIVEMPNEGAEFTSDAALGARFADRRAFLRRQLLHDPSKEFSAGGHWMVGEVYMTITGQLFFDDWHVGSPPRGKQPKGHAGKAATLWEIHPVTDIRFAPKP